MNIIFASLAALALTSGAGAGIHRGPSVDDGLARAIAASAVRAEEGLAPARIRAATAVAGSDVITTYGDEPARVRESLEWVLQVCPGEEARRLGYSCPSTPQAYQGLSDLLLRVAKLATRRQPAAGLEHEGAAFGPPPDFTGGGGADYRGAP